LRFFLRRSHVAKEALPSFRYSNLGRSASGIMEASFTEAIGTSLVRSL